MISACRLKKLLYIIPVLLFLCIVSKAVWFSYSMSSFMRSFSRVASLNGPFITTKFYPAMSARLGNHLFESLALIGIADQLSRTPYIQGNHSFLSRPIWKNLNASFPRLSLQFAIIPDYVSAKEIPFHGVDCCIYEDPNRLKTETAEYLELIGNYFQSYKYFDHLRESIRWWLLPNITVQKKVEGNFPQELKNRFLTCVHIRREDFVTSMQKDPSSADFTIKALGYLMQKYNQEGRKFGTIILGNEIEWEKKSFGKLPDTHIVENSTVAEDFALSRMFCDAFLITAPSSSFGWFLGYVSKTMNVYYRDITDTNDLTSTEMKQDDFFLPSWIRLRETNESVAEVTRTNIVYSN